MPMVSAVYTIAVPSGPSLKVKASTGRVCAEIEPAEDNGFPSSRADRSLYHGTESYIVVSAMERTRSEQSCLNC